MRVLEGYDYSSYFRPDEFKLIIEELPYSICKRVNLVVDGSCVATCTFFQLSFLLFVLDFLEEDLNQGNKDLV
jgi:hypothetical protein